MKPKLILSLSLIVVLSAVACSRAGTEPIETAIPSPEETGTTYRFDAPQDCADWEYLTPGPGNEFANGVAGMSASRGRSFLLNTVPQPADVAVEVKAANISGPALAWILMRRQDTANFYEITLKKTHLEVWRKHQGRYLPILRRLDISLGDPAATHLLKAQMVGPIPAIAVWLDGRLLWSGKENLGLDPLEGRHVAIETEFSSIAVHSVSILKPDTSIRPPDSEGQILTPPSDERDAASAVTWEEAFSDLYQTLGSGYPCFRLKNIDWKAVGDELLPRAKTVKTDDEFGLLCMELVAGLEDSHAALLDGARKVPVPPFPQWDPGFACLIDDRDRPVVYYVDPAGPASAAGVRPGMAVVSVNGEDALAVMEERMKQTRRYQGYSSDRYLRYHAAQWLGRRMERNSTVTLLTEDPRGKTDSFELAATLGVRYLPRLPVPIEGIRDAADVAWKMLPDNIGYIYVRRIRNNLIEQLDQAVGQLNSASGLIIDVRGNSGGGFDSERSFRNFSPDDPKEPARARFGGPIAVLIDARCISAGEGWVSWFVANKRARFFGETTAGASSRKTTYTLKNGFYRVTFPVKAYTGFLDRPIERLGIVPDVPVRQNAADLARGRDTVLEAAKDCLLGTPAREE